MSDHYHDPKDLRLLKEMGKLAPTEFDAWLNLDNIVSAKMVLYLGNSVN